MIAIRNGGRVACQEIPAPPVAAFRDAVLGAVSRGGRIVSLFGWPRDGVVRLLAVLAPAPMGSLALVSTDVAGAYPALTPECPQAHWFEREIWEQTGVEPRGHPWLKPIRFIGGEIGVTEFFRVQGEEVHEVAVGPVHAGVIEPGHFRFQCHGERVLHLEISLGYQHRGVERALLGGPEKRAPHLMETLAGDTSIGHATAFAMVIESLAGCAAPARAEALRGIALELERLANHTGDLGALANDVGYLPTASYCGRLRGDFLNLTALLCGSRFGRGMVRPGGVAFDADAARLARLGEKLAPALREVTAAVNLLWDTPSVMARFEGTGRLSRQTCEALGLVGPVARACGVERDARRDFPFGIYRFAQVPVSTWPTGDVFARAYLRWMEMRRSAAFLQAQVQTPPEGPTKAPLGSLAPESVALALVEGWRGEICHTAITDAQGRFAAYKVVDPSFHNWIGLAMALRDQQISDFPLCNKSFNLSYCGHDL